MRLFSLICFWCMFTRGICQLGKLLKVGSSIPSRLSTAYSLFKVFCRSLRATPLVKTFSRDNLNWESLAKYPDASFKGSDVKLLLQWLIDFMYHDNTREQTADTVCQNALDAARCMDDFLRLIFTSHRVLISREAARSCLNLLQEWHVKSHSCARLCFDRGLCFFNLAPKGHYLFHVSADLKKQLEDENNQNIISPAAFSTQMAEDYIGKSCRVARAVHPCTAVMRTAQKWLVFQKQWWDKDSQ